MEAMDALRRMAVTMYNGEPPFYPDGNAQVFSINLPPADVAALMARNSRNTGTMREAYDSIVADGKSLHRDTKAFMRRVIDTYGDDSVSQLGVGYIAFEGISRAAAILIEQHRMAAYSEKSSRYAVISSEEAPSGKSGFIIPDFASSTDRMHYMLAMRGLFETYEGMRAEYARDLREAHPKLPEETDTAYSQAVNAASLDIARHLLPMGYRTNVAVTGSGAYFEHLMQHLRALADCGWKEMGDLAQGLRVALSHKMEALIRRIDNPTYFDAGVAYERRNYTRIQPVPISAYPSYGVTVAHLTEFAGLDDLMEGTTFETLDEMVAFFAEHRTDRRILPGRVFEHTMLTFDVRTTIGCFADMQRHRISTITSRTMFDQAGHNHVLDETRQFHQFAYRNVYNTMVEKCDMPWEALYVIPLGALIEWRWTMNLREFFHVSALRTGTQGHPEYRELLQSMTKQILNIEPTLEPLFNFVNWDTNVPLPRRNYENRLDRKDARLEY